MVLQQLAPSDGSSTAISINGTTTTSSISTNGTSSDGSISSGTTSAGISSDTSASTLSSTTSTDVNGDETALDASANNNCLKISLLGDAPASETFCINVSPNNGGSVSAGVTITQGNQTTGGSTSINNILPTSPPSISPSLFSITKTQSGLVSSDPLNNETQTREELEAEQGYWYYGGSAFTYFDPPAPTDLYKDTEGLHIGVQTTTNGTYAGYYAVAQPSDAKLFHSVISTPVRTISGDFFQNGLYVQTNDGRINYVTCVSITSTAGTSWHIVRTFGDLNQATQFEVLWSDGTANQPLTRDCTIITNGVNYLKVYIDGVKVYENNSIDLQMPGPFLYFLEPQNSHAQMLYGVYDDYYTTTNESIEVINAPLTASRVDVVDSTGNVLASSSVTNGTATLDVGMYHFPLNADIIVYDSNNTELVSMGVNIFGGDEYAVISQ
ncbi:MAG: hypothetical protein HZC29_07935 [Thaumarchaeota archaeon]|nr:hypothetical protein [Nitrososphaerota archaeon]